MRSSSVAAAAALALGCALAQAQDLGTIGPVYPIGERNLLELILARLHQAQASGALAGLQQDAQRRARRALDDPAPVATVSRTTQPRTHYHDPSLIVPHPVTDAEGRVIAAPGTRINPLDTVSLSKALLFFDARDPLQLERARALLDERGARLTLILTGGSAVALMHRWARPVFHDQQGSLVARLGIRQVPALVTQADRRLRIDELR